MRHIRGLLLFVCAAVVCACGSNPASSSPPPPPTPDPPKITCPSAVSVTSPTGQPIPVSYGSATVALGKAPVTTNCTPESGAAFPVGTTTVTCTATDSLQRTDTCTFGVTVAAPPRISLTRFVGFGDSITWGEDGQNTSSSSLRFGPVRPAVQVPISQTYPGALQLLFAARYTTQSITVANAGCPGELAADSSSPCTGGTAVSRFRGVVGSGSYQAVLLMEGANDIAEQLAEGGNTAPVDAAIRALQSMIDFAKSQNVRPYLATITPENYLGTVPARRGGAANFVPPFNDRVRALASAEGVTLVDVYAGMTAVSGWETSLIGPDGLHPTVAGYANIAQTFFTALRGTLEIAPASIVTAPFSLPARTGSFARPRAAGPGSRSSVRPPR